MGFVSDAKDYLKNRVSLKTIASEIGDAVENRFNHGRSELGNVLYAGSAYTQYGQGDMAPVDPADLGQLTPDNTPSYDANLEITLNQAPSMDRGIEP